MPTPSPPQAQPQSPAETQPQAPTQAPTKNQTKAPQQCTASEDPKSFMKQCTQLTNPENDTCCYGQFTCKDKTFALNGDKCEKNITLYQAPICNTCDSNTHLLYKGKCIPKTELGCCFMQYRPLKYGYYCNMKDPTSNCTLTTERECLSLDWAALGSNADLGFATHTCSLDLSFSSSPDPDLGITIPYNK